MPAIWSSPLCLIKSDDNNKLEIVESTAKKLSQMCSPLPVVSITGDRRTGKSFLSNWLARNISPKGSVGFLCSSSVDSCTKGIWVWLLKHPTQEGQSLLLMDTEGLGDVQKGDSDYDQWIFALTVLLSNVLIYNNLGAINNDALEKLHLTMAIAEDIMGKSGAGNQSPSQGKYFVWAARDFSLNLEIENGKPISSDEYLEWSLQNAGGQDIGLCDFLDSNFLERKCFTFPHPTTDRSVLNKLDGADDEQIDEGFKEVATAFLGHVNCKLRQLHPCQLSGGGFVCLVRKYLEAIKDGRTFTVGSVWQTVIESENNRAVEESLKRYNREMENAKLPTDSSETLSAISTECYRKALDVFRQIALHGSEEKLKLLEHDLDVAREHWRCKNVAASKEACLAELAKLSRRLDENVEQEKYMVLGGHAAYSADLQQLVDSYNSRAVMLGVMHEECLEQFHRDRHGQKNIIKTNDEKLKELEENLREEKQRAEALRREEQRAREREEQRMREEEEERQRREMLLLAARFVGSLFMRRLW